MSTVFSGLVVSGEVSVAKMRWFNYHSMYEFVVENSSTLNLASEKLKVSRNEGPSDTDVNAAHIAQRGLESVALLLSPLPHHVEKDIHWLGVLDTILLLCLLGGILYSRRVVFTSKVRVLFLVMVAIMMFGFSLASTSHGTMVRHRAKFVPILILALFCSQRRASVGDDSLPPNSTVKFERV
jgi:hypothetical protein